MPDGSGRMAGQVAIVTGSSRGIGHFMARELAKEGCAVVVAARSEQVTDPRLPGTIFTVADELRALGAKALPFRLDVTDEDGVKACVAATLAEFGRIDLLVNNAGLMFPMPFQDFPLRRLDLLYRINVRAPAALTQAVLPHMLERGSGTVITVSSGAADQPSVNNITYAMTKVAIEKLMQGLAAELDGKGLRFFGLKPSRLVLTPGAMYHALRRPTETEPEEHMGLAAVWLCTSPAAAALNGRSFRSGDVLEKAAAG